MHQSQILLQVEPVLLPDILYSANKLPLVIANNNIRGAKCNINLSNRENYHLQIYIFPFIVE
jgi:hypothetical protein